VPKRRRFGSVRQLPSGRWQARYLDTRGAAQPAPRTFVRKTDADLWLAAVEADMSRGTFVDTSAGKMTVAEWSWRWFDSAAGRLKIKTRATYVSLLKTKILPRFGDMRLPDIKPIMVGEWIADLQRQGFSASRIRQSYRLFSQIMRAATENDLITISPCRGIRLPRQPPSEPHIVSEQEADRIIAATPSPHDALVMLLAYGGLRIGEAFALRRNSIDLDAGTVTISQTLVEITGQLSFDTPKTHQTRTVTLPHFVVERLYEVLNQIDEAPTALLFPTRTGKPQHYNSWRTTYFKPAVRAVGRPEVTPHDLRASHATWVAERYGVMAAAARLGHAHASVTTRHYARSTEGKDRIVADGFDRTNRDDNEDLNHDL
jgi:integrase